MVLLCTDGNINLFHTLDYINGMYSKHRNQWGGALPRTNNDDVDASFSMMKEQLFFPFTLFFSYPAGGLFISSFI